MRNSGSSVMQKFVPCFSEVWEQAVVRSKFPDQTEQMAGYGRWWMEHASSRMVLSAVAAEYLNVSAGMHTDVETCFRHVVSDDMPLLIAALWQTRMDAKPIDCVFRVLDPLQGIRWLRMRSTPAVDCCIELGMLIDVTAIKHAEMREKFNFALTQYLIGTDSLAEAVNSIIQLVCIDLGWEWGAYWEFDEEGENAGVMRCKHFWHITNERLERFRIHSESTCISPGEGILGQVWQSGEAQWVDTAAGASGFIRKGVAVSCGLRSGYIFPVTYRTVDGTLHKPGVLEFFSNLPRQLEAQLPGLANSISALIAQTAERLAQQEKIRHLAQVDEMTGLYNRNHFHFLLDKACRNTAPNRSFGVLYIDLDQFKPINDAFGHAVGNFVLTEFARRLQQTVPAGCVIGRLGGDEFAILTTPEFTQENLNSLTGDILQVARRTFIHADYEMNISASIGVSVYPFHGRSTSELLHTADAAMYMSKRSGRNQVSHMTEGDNDHQEKLVKKMTLVSQLHRALHNNEFFLEYQPIYNSCNESMMAVEALIRWRKESGEIVMPDQFIPVAEQSNLIVRMGLWVVEQVCRELSLLKANGFPDIQVHVNMAAPAFMDGTLPAKLITILDHAGIKPQQICLELTEGVVMSAMEKSIPIMQDLRRIGFSISMDDFGMGYSSLAILKKLPITSIKIDRLFMTGVPRESDDCAIVRAILDLGRRMRLPVIAEGVETDVQLSFLRQFGCHLIQGYLFSRPIALDKLVALHLSQKN